MNNEDELSLFALRNLKSHFIFNTLTAIEYLCRHDSESASKALTTFSSYLRMNLNEAKLTTLIPFDEELNHSLDYITLINIRYKGKIKYYIDVDDSNFVLPPLSLTALVENAFKHGISHLEGTGIIKIVVRHHTDKIVINVTDNGPGYQNQPFQFGLTDVKTRIQKYSRGTVAITNNTPYAGSTATITIPVNRIKSIR